MKDSYRNFANTDLGSRLTGWLGLPRPLPLVRHVDGRAVIAAPVLLGGCDGAELLPAVADILAAIGAQTRGHSGLPSWPTVATQAGAAHHSWDEHESVGALLFDASGLTDSSQSAALYQFFHDTVRSLLPSGRVIILGRPPEHCERPRQATVQRALEGLSRSLGKELKRAIAVQLVYVAPGAEQQLESTLRFLLSPRSAYVSGQVVRVGLPIGGAAPPADWARPLAGQRVLVTGAAQGIGAAIAERMAADGAEVTCLDIPAAGQQLDAVAGRVDGSALTLDIGAADAALELAAAAPVGGWQVVVHNAGITRDKTIAKMSRQFWLSVVDINLSAQERINDALLESGALGSGGRIVSVSSMSGIAGNFGQTNYAFSKAGVIGMVESSAPLLAARGITINAVAPGFIETQMTAAMPLMTREAGRRLNSMSQGGLPVDVAETIGWLASPGSAGLTGNVIRVCGQSLLGA